MLSVPNKSASESITSSNLSRQLVETPTAALPFEHPAAKEGDNVKQEKKFDDATDEAAGNPLVQRSGDYCETGSREKIIPDHGQEHEVADNDGDGSSKRPRIKRARYAAATAQDASLLFLPKYQRPTQRPSISSHLHNTSSLSYGRNGWVCHKTDESLVVGADGSLSSNQLNSTDNGRYLESSQITWRQTMCCVFCKSSAEDSLCGRLLMLPTKSCYAHVNCLRASRGVIETGQGLLTGIDWTVDRALETTCRLCGIEGASIRCERPACRETFAFHLKCAAACNFHYRYMILVWSHLLIRSL